MYIFNNGDGKWMIVGVGGYDPAFLSIGIMEALNIFESIINFAKDYY